MFLIFRLLCKELIRFAPALLVITILQCVMGQLAAVALNERDPEMNVGYYIEKHTSATARYIEGLSATPGISLTAAETMHERGELFSTGSIQAFVLINESFDRSISDGISPAVTLFRAPGVSDFTLLKGHLTNQWMILRTEALAAPFLGDNYIIPPQNPDKWENSVPVISLVYEGPLLQNQLFITPPAFGIPALLLLLSFLHSAGFAAGSDKAMWKMKGHRTLGMGTLISILSVFIFWGCSTLLYVLFMRVFYKISVPGSVVAALLGLVIYVVSAGGLLAFFGGRRFAAWVFVPFLLLNMTVGGGLWNAAAMDMLIPVVLPVSAVLSSATGSWAGSFVLWGQALVIVVFVYVFCRRGKIVRAVC